MSKDIQNCAETGGKEKKEEKRQFIKFMALPYVMRKQEFGFNLLGDFAKKYGVDRSTLSLWQRDEKFQKEVDKYRKVWFKERTPNVIQALYKRIISEGKAPEAKLWLQYIEDWKERSEIDVNSNELEEISKALRKLADE